MSSKYIDVPGANAMELARTRGMTCEWCRHKRDQDFLYRARTGTEFHHALVRRDVRFKKFLNVEENYALVCHTCHMSGEVDTPEFREWFWKVQVVRYGEERMQSWIQSLPFKVDVVTWK